MALMPPKPPTKPLPSTVAYRPPPEQAAWWGEKLNSGWSQAEVLTEVVATFMQLETLLAPIEKDLEAFARSESLLKPGQDAAVERGWVREAVVRLVKRGHKEWKQNSGKK
jgi:cell division inhibitor SulA